MDAIRGLNASEAGETKQALDLNLRAGKKMEMEKEKKGHGHKTLEN
jgi:hypothetical protein